MVVALKQMREKSKDRTTCPRCGAEALLIQATTVKWLTCPYCKFKKLMEAEKEDIKVTPLIDKDQL